MPVQLLKAALAATSNDTEFSLAAVIAPYSNQCNESANTVLNFDSKKNLSVQDWAFKNDVPFIAHTKDQLSDNTFVESLFSEYQSNVLLSFYCLQVFRPDFLNKFQCAINYHNSLLPKYRGTHASAWAIAMGEKVCGYTFHHINEALDEGNILIQESIKISKRDKTADLEKRMVKLAVKKIPVLFQLIKSKDFGVPQSGEATYYSIKDYNNIKWIKKPFKLPSKQLLTLCRAFGDIRIYVANKKWFKATQFKIAKSSKNDPNFLYFESSDGKLIEACKLSDKEHLKAELNRYILRLKKRLGVIRLNR